MEFLFKVHDDDNDDNDWRVWDAKNRVREVIKCEINRDVGFLDKQMPLGAKSMLYVNR